MVAGTISIVTMYKFIQLNTQENAVSNISQRLLEGKHYIPMRRTDSLRSLLSPLKDLSPWQWGGGGGGESSRSIHKHYNSQNVLQLECSKYTALKFKMTD